VTPEPLAFAYKPVPATFTAATWKVYDVPFVRPVTVAEVLVEAVRVNVVHVVLRHDCTV
jgi:hypothetical protein